MAAIRAVDNTSPFLRRFCEIRVGTSAFVKTTKLVAVAEREVMRLFVMLTMCAAPVEVRCGRGLGAEGLDLVE